MHYPTQIQDTSRRLSQHEHGTIPLYALSHPNTGHLEKPEPARTRNYPTICTIPPNTGHLETPVPAPTRDYPTIYMHYPTQIQDTSRRLSQHQHGTIPLCALSHPNTGHLDTPEPTPTRDYPTMCTIPPKYRTPRDACASTNTGLSHYVHYPTQIQDTSRRLCQHPPGTIPLYALSHPAYDSRWPPEIRRSDDPTTQRRPRPRAVQRRPRGSLTQSPHHAPAAS
jgi:hypothetical protein